MYGWNVGIKEYIYELFKVEKSKIEKYYCFQKIDILARINKG